MRDIDAHGYLATKIGKKIDLAIFFVNLSTCMRYKRVKSPFRSPKKALQRRREGLFTLDPLHEIIEAESAHKGLERGFRDQIDLQAVV